MALLLGGQKRNLSLNPAVRLSGCDGNKVKHRSDRLHGDQSDMWQAESLEDIVFGRPQVTSRQSLTASNVLLWYVRAPMRIGPLSVIHFPTTRRQQLNTAHRGEVGAFAMKWTGSKQEVNETHICCISRVVLLLRELVSWIRKLRYDTLIGISLSPFGIMISLIPPIIFVILIVLIVTV